MAIARAHARPDAEIAVAVDANGMPLDQAGRSALVIEAAREGRTTVRLISGDPVIDGSLLHEAGALRKARIEFEVAPGVSEVSGVPAYAGFGLTGGRVRQVRIVDANDTDLPWAELAAPRTTVVFLNGADRAPDIAARLVSAGADSRLAVAVTRRGTTVDQRTIVVDARRDRRGRQGRPPGRPRVLVVGEVVGAARRARRGSRPSRCSAGGCWCRARRTRPARSSAGCAATAPCRIEVPTISVEPPRTPQQMDRAVQRPGRGPLRVDRVHLGQRGAGRPREVRGVRPRRPRRSPGSRSRPSASRPPPRCARSASRPTSCPPASSPARGLLEEWPSTTT